MPRKLPKNRPLPRPTRTELAVLGTGFVVLLLSTLLHGAVAGIWPHLIWFFGVVITGSAALRITIRRMDAIRSRPPL